MIHKIGDKLTCYKDFLPQDDTTNEANKKNSINNGDVHTIIKIEPGGIKLDKNDGYWFYTSPENDGITYRLSDYFHNEQQLRKDKLLKLESKSDKLVRFCNNNNLTYTLEGDNIIINVKDDKK